MFLAAMRLVIFLIYLFGVSAFNFAILKPVSKPWFLKNTSASSLFRRQGLTFLSLRGGESAAGEEMREDPKARTDSAFDVLFLGTGVSVSARSKLLHCEVCETGVQGIERRMLQYRLFTPHM